MGRLDIVIFPDGRHEIFGRRDAPVLPDALPQAIAAARLSDPRVPAKTTFTFDDPAGTVSFAPYDGSDPIAPAPPAPPPTSPDFE